MLLYDVQILKRGARKTRSVIEVSKPITVDGFVRRCVVVSVESAMCEVGFGCRIEWGLL